MAKRVFAAILSLLFFFALVIGVVSCILVPDAKVILLFSIMFLGLFLGDHMSKFSNSLKDDLKGISSQEEISWKT